MGNIFKEFGCEKLECEVFKGEVLCPFILIGFKHEKDMKIFKN